MKDQDHVTRKPSQKAADVVLAEADGETGRRYVFSGDWRHQTAEAMADKLKRLGKPAGGRNEFDFSGITGMDTAGAWIIRRFMNGLGSEDGGEVRFAGGGERYVELVRALPKELRQPERSKRRDPLFQRLFAPIGEVTVSIWTDTVAAMYILGSAVRGAQMKLGRHAGVSPAAIVHQIDRMGVMATPIITLMSFLIGAIIAQQGAFQLRSFGAEIFVVDLVGILQLREIGVLLTAIMIAGRSGSAITAEIGSMKMREEVDALKVMGLSPVGVLVFPRLVALTIVLPLLTIIANFAALAGAALVAWSYSGITIPTFLARLQEAVDFSSVAAGMIKAPFMALIIGVVAAVEGLKVGGSAESLGRRVTSSVVKSIFVVILIDGLFAMFYAAIDF